MWTGSDRERRLSCPWSIVRYGKFRRQIRSCGVITIDNRDLAEAEAFGWVNTAAPKGKPAPINRASTPAPAAPAQAAKRPRTRPAAPDFNAIPAGLQARDQWVLWKLEDRAGKQTKVPYYVRVGDDGTQLRPASTTDPATWSSFDKIREDFERFVAFDLVSGIGFVFVKGDGIVGIDVDHKRDPITGRWEPGILEKIRLFNSYAELSQSGTGAHVIVLGEKPGTRCRGDVEIYDAGRFFVMTGRHISQTPSDVQEAAAGTLEAQYRQIDPGRRTVQPAARSSALPVRLEDAEVIRRAASALNGPKFTALFRAGDLAAYGGDHSAADLALCNLLVFWTQDRDQIDRIFRGSALMRPKWDERRGTETYGGITIGKAFSSSTRTCPPAPATVTESAGEDLDALCKDFHLTDAGNGERFAARWGETTRYCHPRKLWFQWDGTHWGEDQGRAIIGSAKETARAIYREAELERDDARRPALARWAVSSEGKKRLEDMLFMASSEAAVRIMPDELDADGNLFNLQNGTLELDTLRFREHRKEDLITKIAGVAYDPSATCPLWENHLDLIFGGKPDMILAFQEQVGYCMLAGNPLSIFPIWWGAGENGKSVTISTIQGVFGDYAYSASADTFMEARTDGTSARSDLVALRGARLVTAVETDRGKHLAEGLIKSMTGGDPLTARGLYMAPETFTPEFTPVLATNNNPVIRGNDHAIWRRIRRWPFTVRISDEQKVLNYDQRLAGEGPGILNWMIEGLRRYYAAGCRLAEPPELMASTNAYRAEQDFLHKFIDEMCTVSESAICLRTDLYAAYAQWCNTDQNDSDDLIPPKEFYRALRDRNYPDGKRLNNGRAFTGIRLKTTREREEWEFHAGAGTVSYQVPLLRVYSTRTRISANFSRYLS